MLVIINTKDYEYKLLDPTTYKKLSRDTTPSKIKKVNGHLYLKDSKNEYESVTTKIMWFIKNS